MFRVFFVEFSDLFSEIKQNEENVSTRKYNNLFRKNHRKPESALGGDSKPLFSKDQSSSTEFESLERKK